MGGGRRRRLRAISDDDDDEDNDGEEAPAAEPVKAEKELAAHTPATKRKTREAGGGSRPAAVNSRRCRTFERGSDDFATGNIVRMELDNFMTYNHIVIEPSSRLNLIVGPNGTGKSSLVCAIGVGLDGEAKMLGRAGNLGDYVQRGKDWALVRVTLRGNLVGENIRLERKIFISGKSEWKIDGRPCTKKNVDELVELFNIQIGNLTQFLPQDRVAEFAKLSAIDLLLETERAVGDPVMCEHHQYLKDKGEQLKMLEMTVNQHSKSLEQLAAKNAELEGDVEKMQQRGAKLLEADIMLKKLPWLRYEEVKADYMQAKDDLKVAKENLQTASKALQQAEVPIRKEEDKKKLIDAHCAKLKTTMSNLDNRRESLLMEEGEMRKSLRQKEGEIQVLRTSEEQRKVKLARAQEDLAKAEQDLAELPACEAPREEMRKLGAAIKQLALLTDDKHAEKTRAEGKWRQLAEQHAANSRRLEMIANAKHRGMQALKQFNIAPNIGEISNWIEQNRGRFQGRVYGPVLTEVSVQHKQHATYLEQHVPNWIWGAFITTHSEDRDMLMANLEHLRIAVINTEDQHGNLRDNAPDVTDEMKALGVMQRLDGCFTAPPVVRRVLMAHGGVHHSFVGNLQADRQADQVASLGIKDLWTPESHYRWTESRYSGYKSTIIHAVRPGRLFSSEVNATEAEGLERKQLELEREINCASEEVKGLQTECKDLEKQSGEKRKEQDILQQNFQDEKRKRDRLQGIIVQRKERLETMRIEEDVEKAEAEARREIAKTNERRFKTVMNLKDVLVVLSGHFMDLSEKLLSSAELDIAIKDLKGAKEDLDQSASEAKQAEIRASTEAQRLRGELKAALANAQAVASLTDELQEEFAKLPGTVEELEFAIEECKEEANSILCPNPHIMEEYEHRKVQISELHAKLATEKAELDAGNRELKSTELRDLVSNINRVFSHNFAQMAVAGEVCLDERGQDYGDYGILIKVQFRDNDRLSVLDAQRQSGGERSVSTILYLVSLQEMTQCPFRVVDEINQGMDPKNERKMFQQLVRASGQLNTSQCFLLTPKLLPDLDYGENCCILNIMNGPWINSAAESE
eukprot:SM000072S21215  [mRNA]  locus=s72:375971:384123:- [translate_table: standard]